MDPAEGAPRMDAGARQGTAAAQIRQSPVGTPANTAPVAPAPATGAPTFPESEPRPAAANGRQPVRKWASTFQQDILEGFADEEDLAPPGPPAGRAGGAGIAAYPLPGPDPGPPQPRGTMRIPLDPATPGNFPGIKQEGEGRELGGDDDLGMRELWTLDQNKEGLLSRFRDGNLGRDEALVMVGNLQLKWRKPGALTQIPKLLEYVRKMAPTQMAPTQADGEVSEEDGTDAAAEGEPAPDNRWLGDALKKDLRNLQGELESRVAALEGRFAAWSGPGVPERKDPTTLDPEDKEAVRLYFALQGSLKLDEAPDLESHLGVPENEVRTYFSRLHNQMRRVFEKMERKNQEVAAPRGEREFSRMKSELADQRRDWGDVLMACRDLDNAGTATIFVAFMRRTHNPIVMHTVLRSLLTDPGFLITRQKLLVQAGFLEALRGWASPARIADRQSTLLSCVLHVLSALQLDTAPPNVRRGLEDILALLRDLAGYHRPPIAADAQRLLKALGPAAPG